MILFFSKVVERVRQIAPGVCFELIPFDDHPDEPLTRGEVDFLIFPEIFLSNGHPRVSLFEETFVCVACNSNREAKGKLRFGKYMSMGHVAAQFGRTRVPAIEEWLMLKHGLKRRIEVAVQSFSMIPHFVAFVNGLVKLCVAGPGVGRAAGPKPPPPPAAPPSAIVVAQISRWACQRAKRDRGRRFDRRGATHWSSSGRRLSVRKCRVGCR